MPIVALVVATHLFTGCGPSIQRRYSTAIGHHARLSKQIEIGDSKEQVLRLLEPAQQNLPSGGLRPPDRFVDGETLVEIYYFRSGFVSDGVVTDDEFTPYVFKNGRLASTGWAALGGPKTRAQRPLQIEADVDVH